MKLESKETKVISIDFDTWGWLHIIFDQYGFLVTSHFPLITSSFNIEPLRFICQVLLDQDTPNGGLLEEGDVCLVGEFLGLIFTQEWRRCEPYYVSTQKILRREKKKVSQDLKLMVWLGGMIFYGVIWFGLAPPTKFVMRKRTKYVFEYGL